MEFSRDFESFYDAVSTLGAFIISSFVLHLPTPFFLFVNFCKKYIKQKQTKKKKS